MAQKKTFEQILIKVMRDADIILLLLDPRRVQSNPRIEQKIKERAKKFIYVVSKSDLVTRPVIAKIKSEMKDVVIVSATKHIGLNKLLARIMDTAHLMGKEKVTVGVVGFPNTGKSTLINSLKGHKSAGTSPISGYTKGVQKLKINNQIMMLDTPGVLPHTKPKLEYVLIGAITPDKMKDPESIACELITELKGAIEEHFGVQIKEDAELTLEEIAFKKKLLLKGGEPDTRRIAEEIIRLVQRGAIKW